MHRAARFWMFTAALLSGCATTVAANGPETEDNPFFREDCTPGNLDSPDCIPARDTLEGCGTAVGCDDAQTAEHPVDARSRRTLGARADESAGAAPETGSQAVMLLQCVGQRCQRCVGAQCTAQPEPQTLPP